MGDVEASKGIFWSLVFKVDLLTSRMTVNHLNNARSWFSSKKSHKKRGITPVRSVISVTNHVFRLLDLVIYVLTFNKLNNTRNGLFSQYHIKHIYYTSSQYLCLLKIIFVISLTLELTFWLWRRPWRWPSITKIKLLMAFRGKIAWKWGLTDCLVLLLHRNAMKPYVTKS